MSETRKRRVGAKTASLVGLRPSELNPRHHRLPDYALENNLTTVLVIDDDRSVRHIVRRGLEGHHDFRVVEADDGDTGLQALAEHEPVVCLLDVFLPEYNGLELFRKIKAIDNKLPVIFITGDTSSDTAIEAMRAGAFDYLAKPLNIEQLRQLTLSAAKARHEMDQPVALPVGSGDADLELFVGTSKAMIEVYKDIGRVAAQTVPVLIRGESGAGKELVARALVNHSARRDKPFISVNCAAIPDQLLESELFGHEKGAFTGAEKKRLGRFEQCDGGTIFLDEVGDMSQVIQGKVLRLLQEQRFERVGGNEIVTTDVRIIAATNRPLEQMVKDDEFREDLLYRLNGFQICLPPLRQRRDDVPLLLEYFLRRAKAEMERPDLTGLTPEALKKLIAYDWPGNVRQLQSVVRQSLLNSPGTVIGADSLPDFITINNAHAAEAEGSASHTAIPETTQPTTVAPERTAAAAATNQPDRIQDAAPSNMAFNVDAFIEQRLREDTTNLYDEVVEQLERRLFAKVLEVSGGNQSKAAEILGITRGKVRDRIAAFGIQLDRTVSVPGASAISE